MLLLTTLAWPCTWYVYDDYADGSADGSQYGGTFVTGGWRPDGGTIVYDLPDVVAGNITFRLSNVDERGVGQHDLLELFSGDDGSFSDGRRDNFLQVKFAGDVYDGYHGRVKLQAGPEWYGEVEVGAWTDEYDWDPDRAYDFTVAWSGTEAWLDIAGERSTAIDFGVYGELSFRTLRVPNDGSYTRDGGMDDILIGGVSLCGDPAEPDTTTDTPTDTATEVPTDTGTDVPEDTGSPPTPAPTIGLFRIVEGEVLPGEPWRVEWSVQGSVEATRLCMTGPDLPWESCTLLTGATGRQDIPTVGLTEGLFEGWIHAEGPGGTTLSASQGLAIVPRPVASADGCGCGSGGPPAWALVAVGTVASLRRRW